ncbi:response regulator transcription factor [Leeia oryzae]|uniref:response regulator transcription factor n=1 Tax=Leeia oryzae TaxID=356662 RepID=UPI000379B854|nr:response regulator transcription factor [Leeia oryzae]
MTPNILYFASTDKALLDRWALAYPDAKVLPADLNFARAVDKAIVLVDATVPGIIAEDSALWAHKDRLLLVICSMAPEDEEGLQMLQAGAVGYVHAYCDPEMLQQVVNVVSSGEIWVGRNLMMRLLKGVHQLSGQTNEHALDSLTERERQVATLTAKGQSNKEIARALDITERTVKAHISTIFEKMGVSDRLQLALKVNGLTG